ncbi:MAG: acyl-CoA dehydrogenase family protein [Candidatus Eremiobacteraeota bacterium]|nr:acyl-CoA dehydrogenase family protein [Candidatus Eremiobacteraeota bacterium]
MPDAVDFIDVAALLTDEERLVRDTVRAFVRDRVLPNIAEWFEAGALPRDLGTQLGSLGVLGMHLEGYGCPGAGAVAYGVACLELEAGDSGVRSFASVQGSLAMYAIYRFGDEAQKRAWLPAMARGELVGCFGLSEPDFGSNPAGMRTSARRDGSDWILDGTKMWITNGSIADLAVVWAQTEDGIRGFIVPRETRGFSSSNIHRKLSLRASVTSELIFAGCRVPADALLPQGRGLGAPLACLNEARYGIVWGSMGAARSCYETALEYSKTRVQFDRPIGGYQLTQAKLVDMLLELNKGTLLALHVGRSKERGRVHPATISLAKLNNVREALQIARQARTILGANGVTLEYPVIRHMNNLESVLTYEGTSEMHTLIVGKEITGLDAFT